MLQNDNMRLHSVTRSRVSQRYVHCTVVDLIRISLLAVNHAFQNLIELFARDVLLGRSAIFRDVLGLLLLLSVCDNNIVRRVL